MKHVSNRSFTATHTNFIKSSQTKIKPLITFGTKDSSLQHKLRAVEHQSRCSRDLLVQVRLLDYVLLYFLPSLVPHVCPCATVWRSIVEA